jgi:hypothetical protein
MSGAVVGSEDCLTVNVWSPPNAKGLPVMVFLHGGRHVVGGALGGQISFDGARLAEEARVVVFSVEFRFGALGYLTHPALDADADSGRSGNYGMLDQLLGLQWVRENARAFGGEAERVTIFGQSSGSTDIALLLAAPRARGLFHRAILDSPRRRRWLAHGRSRSAKAARRWHRSRPGPRAACARCPRNSSRNPPTPTSLRACDGVSQWRRSTRLRHRGLRPRLPILLNGRDEQALFSGRTCPMRNAMWPWCPNSKVAEQALALPRQSAGTPKGAFIAAMSNADFTCPTRRLAARPKPGQAACLPFARRPRRGGPDAQLLSILSQDHLPLRPL